MYYQRQIEFTLNEILLYLRKSRSDDPTLSVEEVLQKHESILDEWTKQYLGGVVPEDQKFREVVSGETLTDRPEIQKVLRMVESPKYKAIGIVEPQRLTRGDLEDIGRSMKLLKLTNTLVVTPQRIYDLRDEYDWEAFERELKKGNDYLEYTKKILTRGKLLAVSEGQYIGTYPPFGFDKVVYPEGKKKCRTLNPNKDADTVRIIFDLYVNKNMGSRRIADYLNEMGLKPAINDRWAAEGIRDILGNVHYIGKVRWNWKKSSHLVEDGEIKKTRLRSKEYLIYEGRHEAIVPEELFNAAQEKRGKNPRLTKHRNVVNPFAGLVWCKCGRAMSMRPYPNAKVRMVCPDTKHCRNGSCTFDDFSAHIQEVLRESIADFEIRVKNDEGDSIKLHTRLIKNLEKRMKDLQAKELSQWEAQSDPDPAKRMPTEIFQQLNAKLLKEKEEVQEALCKAYESMPEPIDYREKILHFTDALNALTNPTVDAAEKNRLLKACIEKIVYRRDTLYRLTDENGEYLKGVRGGTWNNPPLDIDVTLRV